MTISPIEQMQPEHPSNKGKLIFNEELVIEVDETRGTTEGICGTSKLFPEVYDYKDAIMMGSHCGVEVHKQLVPIVKGLMERISILENKQLELERQVEQLKRREVGQGREYEEMCQHMKDVPSNGSLICQMSSEQLIYLIGGYDGNSLLNALSSFSPLSDVSSTLASMSLCRSYAAATSLNHLLFVFGGRNSDLWLDAVECYNPIDNKWKICPPLSRRKGSLAGATLNGQIFAVGGGNGVDCFYDVEIFDASLGKWIEGQSMRLKRFAPAVADLNGILYASGGYSEDGYLDSVEQFDPRVGSWSWLSSMNYRRASHSLVVLNEKLYAVGGYNGERFVSSMEVYDPRKGSWLLTEPMHTERAYAGCAVLGDSLFVMGGVREAGRIVDDVELYKETTGWTVTGVKSVGKRAYFSAVVL